MKSEKIVKAAKNSVYNMAMLVFGVVIAIWDLIAWIVDGSNLSLWLAIAMLIIAGFDFFFFKRSWAELKALCAEIEN